MCKCNVRINIVFSTFQEYELEILGFSLLFGHWIKVFDGNQHMVYFGVKVRKSEDDPYDVKSCDFSILILLTRWHWGRSFNFSEPQFWVYTTIRYIFPCLPSKVVEGIRSDNAHENTLQFPSYFDTVCFMTFYCWLFT